MKRFFFLILTLIIGQALFISPALARTADPDRFPKFEPLLEPAQGTTPNYSGSVNSSLEGGPPSDGEVGGGENVEDNSNGGNSQADEESQDGATESDNQSSSGSKAKPWGFALLLVLGVILVYGLWKKGKERNEKNDKNDGNEQK